MKFIKTITLSLVTAFSLSLCSSPKTDVISIESAPDDQALYEEIVRQDSAFFHAYNNCETMLAEYAAFYVDNIEFYHDMGGLMTSKQEIVDGTQRNICGKVTRQLIKGSVEVFPIKDFGAIEMGYHTFHNAEEPDAPSNPGRFIVFWQQVEDQWKISKVVSLH